MTSSFEEGVTDVGKQGTKSRLNKSPDMSPGRSGNTEKESSKAVEGVDRPPVNRLIKEKQTERQIQDVDRLPVNRLIKEKQTERQIQDVDRPPGRLTDNRAEDRIRARLTVNRPEDKLKTRELDLLAGRSSCLSAIQS